MFVNDGVDRTDLQRIFFLNSENCEIDSQNRVLMPSRFIEKAGIVRDIVIIGMGMRVEIWSKERYDAMINSISVPDKISLPF